MNLRPHNSQRIRIAIQKSQSHSGDVIVLRKIVTDSCREERERRPSVVPVLSFQDEWRPDCNATDNRPIFFFLQLRFKKYKQGVFISNP
jgi:hypothetical protein